MEKINLSKSKYCKMVQCNKIIWMDKYKIEEKALIDNEDVLKNGTKVGELAKGLFGNYYDIKYSDNLNDMVEETKLTIKQGTNIITEASFNYEKNFCSVDILKNNINDIEIYEVKSSTEIKDIYIDDVSYQYYVLNSLGYKIKKVCIVYINRNYVRNGSLELEKLFNIEDVTQIVINKQEEIKQKIDEINEYMNKYSKNNEPEKDIGNYCLSPYLCEYWQYCSRKLPKNNVFQINSMHKKDMFDFYYKGKGDFKDIINEDINPKFKEQVDFEINNKEPKIEKEKIKEFMDTLSYPIYFLDFETFRQAIPEYDGISPYMQIPFQYSLHYIEKENGELHHKEFLAEAGKDPRRKLAEKLVQDIPMDVCVTAYNMGFEKSVIKNLAKLYPDLSEHLLNIHENIKDLMIPFFKRYYYVKEMEGSYSIKYVLPALYPNDPTLDYHNLPVVHNGNEASNTYASLGEKTIEEQDEIRKGLLVYCKLDTFAMVKVWQKLKEVVGE